MACYPWTVTYERQGQKLEDFPHMKRWFEAIAARPAVQRAYERAKQYRGVPANDPAVAKVLFGQTAATVRRG